MQQDEFLAIADHTWDRAWEILHDDDGWKLEKGSDLQTGLVHSKHYPETGKCFKLQVTLCTFAYCSKMWFKQNLKTFRLDVLLWYVIDTILARFSRYTMKVKYSKLAAMVQFSELFQLQGLINCSAEKVFNFLVVDVETSPTWNPTVAVSKV